MVENYAAEGKSLARQNGKVIFIENVVPGDVVDIRLRKSKKDWAEGYPIQFHSFSKERVQPFCQHFGVCGGCQWQMLPYSQQLIYKQQQVFDNLKRIGKIDLPEMLPIAGAEETKFYRNKLEYTFSTKEFTVAPPQPSPAGRESNAQSQAPSNFPNRRETNTQNQAPIRLPPTGEAISTQEQLKQETFNSNRDISISEPLMVGHSLSTGEGRGGAAVLGFHAKGFFDKIVNIEK